MVVTVAETTLPKIPKLTKNDVTFYQVPKEASFTLKQENILGYTTQTVDGTNHFFAVYKNSGGKTYVNNLGKLTKIFDDKNYPKFNSYTNPASAKDLSGFADAMRSLPKTENVVVERYNKLIASGKGVEETFLAVYTESQPSAIATKKETSKMEDGPRVETNQYKTAATDELPFVGTIKTPYIGKIESTDESSLDGTAKPSPAGNQRHSYRRHLFGPIESKPYAAPVEVPVTVETSTKNKNYETTLSKPTTATNLAFVGPIDPGTYVAPTRAETPIDQRLYRMFKKEEPVKKPERKKAEEKVSVPSWAKSYDKAKKKELEIDEDILVSRVFPVLDYRKDRIYVKGLTHEIFSYIVFSEPSGDREIIRDKRSFDIISKYASAVKPEHLGLGEKVKTEKMKVINAAFEGFIKTYKKRKSATPNYLASRVMNNLLRAGEFGDELKETRFIGGRGLFEYKPEGISAS